MVIYKIRIRQKAFETAECNNLDSRCEQYLGEVSMSTMHTAHSAHCTVKPVILTKFHNFDVCHKILEGQ